MIKSIFSRTLVLCLVVLAAAAARLIPHPPNLTPIAALAVFGGAKFEDRRLAFLVPLAALFISDLVLGFYHHMEVVYAAFAVSVCLGALLRKTQNGAWIIGTVLASSVSFFLITNFGTWAFESLYPHTLAGLEVCYIAAIPFFRNTVIGDLFYAALLFGGFAALERMNPSWRLPVSRAAAV